MSAPSPSPAPYVGALLLPEEVTRIRKSLANVALFRDEVARNPDNQIAIQSLNESLRVLADWFDEKIVLNQPKGRILKPTEQRMPRIKILRQAYDVIVPHLPLRDRNPEHVLRNLVEGPDSYERKYYLNAYYNAAGEVEGVSRLVVERRSEAMSNLRSAKVLEWEPFPKKGENEKMILRALKDIYAENILAFDRMKPEEAPKPAASSSVSSSVLDRVAELRTAWLRDEAAGAADQPAVIIPPPLPAPAPAVIGPSENPLEKRDGSVEPLAMTDRPETQPVAPAASIEPASIAAAVAAPPPKPVVQEASLPPETLAAIHDAIEAGKDENAAQHPAPQPVAAIRKTAQPEDISTSPDTLAVLQRAAALPRPSAVEPPAPVAASKDDIVMPQVARIDTSTSPNTLAVLQRAAALPRLAAVETTMPVAAPKTEQGEPVPPEVLVPVQRIINPSKTETPAPVPETKVAAPVSDPRNLPVPSNILEILHRHAWAEPTSLELVPTPTPTLEPVMNKDTPAAPAARTPSEAFVDSANACCGSCHVDEDKLKGRKQNILDGHPQQDYASFRFTSPTGPKVPRPRQSHDNADAPRGAAPGAQPTPEAPIAAQAPQQEAPAATAQPRRRRHFTGDYRGYMALEQTVMQNPQDAQAIAAHKAFMNQSFQFFIASMQDALQNDPGLVDRYFRRTLGFTQSLEEIGTAFTAMPRADHMPLVMAMFLVAHQAAILHAKNYLAPGYDDTEEGLAERRTLQSGIDERRAGRGFGLGHLSAEPAEEAEAESASQGSWLSRKLNRFRQPLRAAGNILRRRFGRNPEAAPA